MSLLEVDGHDFAYTLVEPGLESRLPYAVGGSIVKNSLFISKDVPEHYRAFILAHEINHDTKYKEMPQEEVCLAALQDELTDAHIRLTDAEFEKYLKGTVVKNGFEGRKGFFAALVELYKDPQQAAARTPEFIEGIKRANEYLVGLNDAKP